jgi:hypothetical protein
MKKTSTVFLLMFVLCEIALGQSSPNRAATLPNKNPQTAPTPTTTKTQVVMVAQSTDIENEIRAPEKAESGAVLAHDTTTLESIWADDFTVNTPYNSVGTRKRGDAIPLYYSKLERNIEKLIVYNNQLVMTMGNEAIIRKPPMTLAGQKLTRRFTHVWMKRNGKWQLAIRHANFICPDMPQQQTK